MAEGIVSKIDEISSRVEELESNLTEITQKNEFGEEILKLQAKVKQTQQNLDENSKELDEELNRLQQKSSSSTAPKEEKKWSQNCLSSSPIYFFSNFWRPCYITI